MIPQAYKLADVQRAQINKIVLRREKQAKAKMVLDFDEMNVMKQVDSMYADIDKQVRKKLKELWVDRFLEMMAFLLAEKYIKRIPDDDEIDELAEMHLAGLLDEPNEVTHYTYAHEVLRKRDKAKEAVLSVPTKAQKQLILDKHLRYVLQQIAWYIDFTSQDAEIASYGEAKVKRVQRHEQKDDRVCAVCKAADGEIYDVDKIPELPHPACRRFFTPVK